MTKTVYVIAMEGEAATGCDWHDTREARDARSGRTGAEYEVHFELEVDPGQDHEESDDTDDAAQKAINNITVQVDHACWDCVWRDGRPWRVVLPVAGVENAMG